ncbi:winged helix-turn-helix domain-containing protein [Ectopseudomonas mendocina]|uniref:Winged helix-turn-helix domain-containing protein n=1 Tax=Ectopseudomonas mendocina TaxID=300 RepID=A0ABZ2RM17_ECTME
MPPLNNRDNYTYAFAHLNLRDEVVFKSIVGLLAGRTHHHWQHVEEGEADLLVLGVDGHDNKPAQRPARAILRIAYQQTDNQGLSVHWPLRANEVFERLEQVAKLLNQPQADTNVAAQPAYKLTRWPPHDVLGHNPAHLRLATLLGARALSCAELSERSGLSTTQCHHFLQRLNSAGLLLEESQPDKPKSESAPQGFFARLRAHLGLS